MSIHSSLRVGDTLKGERSVFTRIERLAVLKKDGRFKEEGSSVYGLPKVRTRFKVAGGKKKAKAEGDAAKPAAAGGAAPAAAAKAGDKKPAAAAAAPAAKKAEKK